MASNLQLTGDNISVSNELVALTAVRVTDQTDGYLVFETRTQAGHTFDDKVRA